MSEDEVKRQALPAVIKGAGALLSALDCIGLSAEEGGDGKVAQIVVDHEQDLRELVRFALDAATQEI